MNEAALLLDVKGLRVMFSQIIAVDDVSLNVARGEIVALLGPNGAGKTTTLRAISGLVKSVKGTIYIDGVRADQRSAPRVARMGIGLVPEGRKVFPTHTVEENLQLGGFMWRRQKTLYAETLSSVWELFPRLYERRTQLAGSLSGGEAQMLAVGRALMLRPRLLVLDEPSLGLAPKVVEELFGFLRRLHSERGLSILLVEQAATRALELADRGYLIGEGRVITAGSSESLRNDPEVQRVYFGSSASE